MEQRDDSNYELVVIIEDATTKLQRTLSQAVTNSVQKEIIGNQAKEIISVCIRNLQENKADANFIQQVETGLKASFIRWYEQITAMLLKEALKGKNNLYAINYKNIAGVDPKKNGKSIIINLAEKNQFETGGISNIREFVTTGETGYSQMFIEDYQKRVNQEIARIANQNVVLRDKRGRRLSVRNLAEMEVRYQEQIKDFERLKQKDTKFVYASSHKNPSKRCEIWQGKLFVIDTEIGLGKPGNYVAGYTPKIVGKLDGINYYSLKDALAHGFLGYNCRHRLVAYKKGMTKPKEYPKEVINAERIAEQKLRSLENKIRNAKRNYLISDDKEIKKEFRQESLKLQKDYVALCSKYKYPIAEWRTRVTLEERTNFKNGNISFEANAKNSGVMYSSLEDSYKIQRINKQTNQIIKRNIELEKKLEREVGMINSIPQKLVDDFGISKDAKIFFRRSTTKREGSAEHIVKSHSSQIDDKFISYIISTLKNPTFVDYEGKNNFGQNRYVIKLYLYTKKNKKRFINIVIDEIDRKNFEFVTLYIKKDKEKA